MNSSRTSLTIRSLHHPCKSNQINRSHWWMMMIIVIIIVEWWTMSAKKTSRREKFSFKRNIHWDTNWRRSVRREAGWWNCIGIGGCGKNGITGWEGRLVGRGCEEEWSEDRTGFERWRATGTSIDRWFLEIIKSNRKQSNNKFCLRMLWIGLRRIGFFSMISSIILIRISFISWMILIVTIRLRIRGIVRRWLLAFKITTIRWTRRILMIIMVRLRMSYMWMSRRNF